MTSKSARPTKDRKTGRVKLKKETLKDLDARDKAAKVKGGLKDPSMGCPQR